MTTSNDKKRIFEETKFVSTFTKDCDDWVTIKKEIMKGLPSRLRKNFSTRNPKTKEQWLNNFEKELINYYYTLTHVNLVLRTLDERREIFGELK
jgi:hypothetical protein